MTESNTEESVRKSGFITLMDKINLWIFEHRLIVILICCATMILTTALKYVVYAPSGFRDATNITALINEGSLEGYDKAVVVTVTLFRLVKSVFGSMSLVGWSWLLLVPGMAIFVFIAWLTRPKGIAPVLVLWGFSVLLPFYVFMPSVDMVQYLVFFVVALAILFIPNQTLKIVVSAMILLPVAYFIRDYYVLMIVIMELVYVFAVLYRKRTSGAQQAIFLMGTMIVVLLLLFILRAVAPKLTDELFTVRTMTNQSVGSAPAPDKLIMDLLPLEKSVPGFLANYIVAGLRLLLPVELFAYQYDGQFAVFQLLLVTLLIVELVRSRRVQGRTAAYSVIIGFYLMSFFFEPDFASWFRHEASAFPIIWIGIGFDMEKEQILLQEQEV